jgi:hypothetical protein
MCSPSPLKADDTDEPEKEASKLKGVYWPGMDLFDSATAEMKRMRNQKKDGTALLQMKRSSAGIEPTEWVFNADGEFRKVRDIFDESTESSSVSGLNFSSPDDCSIAHQGADMQPDFHVTLKWFGLADSGQERSAVAPTPKKRRTRKGVLADISTNAPRLRPMVTKQPTKKVATKRKLAPMNVADAASKKKAHSPHLSLSTDIRFPPGADEYGEFRLTIGDLGKMRKFGIFRDAEDSPGKQSFSTVYNYY